MVLFVVFSLCVTSVNGQAEAKNGYQMLGFKNGQRVTAAADNEQSAATAIEAEYAAETDNSIQQPQSSDYQANINSDVFGAQLFTGTFAKQGATQFNPDYAVAIGDQIQVRFWGAFDFDAVLTVDPKGNIFLPHAGPVAVLGVHNQDLQRVVDSGVETVFRTNVFSYASLAAAQPVRVFVSGFVRRPGLYNGTSMDSLLHYLDQAGGIDPERGSFLQVLIKRNGEVHKRVDLYDFLLEGRIPQVQFTDGDVIFVAPRLNSVKVAGLARNEKRFEFATDHLSLGELMHLAKPSAVATHVRINKNSGEVRNTEYYALAEAVGVELRNGDEVVFTADKKPGTIAVRVEGEHESAQEYVLPYGSKLGDLMSKISFSERSDVENIQLLRVSVRERQKQMLDASLQSLEQAALTARSGTNDESELRKSESDLLLKWVDRARRIEPSGRVLIAEDVNRDGLPLENGDVIKIPAKDGIVLVNGEVLFPTAVAYDDDFSIEQYINRAGGFSQTADSSRVVLSHRDGRFVEAKLNGIWPFTGSFKGTVKPGDEVLVLPKIDVKSTQITKDWSQIMFQLALSAGVVLSL